MCNRRTWCRCGRVYGACGLERRPYGFTNLLGDTVMTLVTGGLWLIWVFVREMKGRYA